jgi:hypothetical protein
VLAVYVWLNPRLQATSSLSFVTQAKIAERAWGLDRHRKHLLDNVDAVGYRSPSAQLEIGTGLDDVTSDVRAPIVFTTNEGALENTENGMRIIREPFIANGSMRSPYRSPFTLK